MADHEFRQIPVARCQACGGEWFRQATYYAFLREESLGRSWDTWPDLTGQDSVIPMTVGVCLCGLPLEPLIGAERGGTGGRELTEFLKALGKGRKWIQENQEGNAVVAAAKKRLATAEHLKILDKRLQTLQREVGRRQRLEPGPGRYWQSPTRQADSGSPGTLTLDRLALMLQERNLSFRKAQEVVHVILSCMIRGLRRGEQVEVPPLGTFFLKDQPKQQRRQRFGRMQTLFRHPTKVAFRPSEPLRMVLATSATRMAEETAERKDQRYTCEKCGSTMFVEGEFRRYRRMPSSMPGGDLRPMEGLAMRALICICGHPKRLEQMGGRLRGDRASFQESFEMALRCQEKADSQVIADSQSAVFAGKEQHMALAERISWTEKIVQTLPRPRR